ncbi:MAG: RHS repeat-associated core domain-containing protein [Thermodesulfobacteriota bacterium]
MPSPARRSLFPRLLLACLLLASLFLLPPPCARASKPGFSMSVPGSADRNSIIRINTSISGGTEGLSLETSGLTILRGWHDHCGFCSDSCLEGDEIKNCSSCCYGVYGCFSTTCAAWGAEFAHDWFGPPTIEVLVTGCSEATVRGRYYGSSHEGPYYTQTHKIQIFGDVEAHLGSIPAEACVGEEVAFDASSTCGAATYQWDFGDGGGGSGKIARHAFTGAGTYQYRVTARTKHDSDSVSGSITIRDDCAAISGTMSYAPDGSPLPGVTVVAQGANSSGSAMSGEDGSYAIIVDGNDTYALTARKSGFTDAQQAGVFLATDGARTWNAALTPLVPDPTENDELLGDQPNDVDDPVNPATGNFHFARTLFGFPGRAGLDFAFAVTYNAAASLRSGPLGFGWTHSYNISLARQGDEAVITWGDGSREYFLRNSATGAYDHVRSRTFATLSDRSGGGYVATLGGGRSCEFDAVGRLEKVTDRNGNAILLSHSTRLDSITDASGRAITFTYAEGRITAIASPLTAGDTAAFLYDANGNLTAIIDPRGNSWTFTYDGQHRLLTETDRSGSLALTNVYDVQGRVVRQTDALGHATTYTYAPLAGNGLRVTITPASGNAVVHEYDAGRNLIRATDATGKTTRFAYAPGRGGQLAGATDKSGRPISVESNQWGQPTQITDPLGVRTTIAYNSLRQPTTISDDAGRNFSMSYDANGNLRSITDFAGGIIRTWINANGTPETVEDKNGLQHQFAYNGQGLAASVTAHANTSLTTSYQYDSAGRVVRTDLPAGLGSILKSFDENGNLLSFLSPMREETTFAWDANDRLLSRTFVPTGAVTSHEYDGLGRLARTVDAEGGITTWTYDPDSNPVSSTDPDGVTVQYSYNARNQLTAVAEAGGPRTVYHHDANGRMTGFEDGDGNRWSMDYDPAGRLVGLRDPLGHAMTVDRSPNDRQQVYTDQLGRTTLVFKDGKERPVTMTRPDGSTSHIGYNVYGDPVSVTDERGNAWSYRYDYHGRLATVKDPDGFASSFGYDALGRMTSFTSRRGQTTTYAYDLDGRLTTTTLPGGATITYTYRHDTAGTTTVTVSEAAGDSTAVLDRMGRPTAKTDILGNTLGFSYTPGGRLRTLTYPGNKTVTYAYDGAGRLASVTDWLGNRTTYAYDALGRIAAIRYPNTTKTIFGHDRRGDLTSISHTAGGSPIVAYTFSRDPAGRILVANQAGGITPALPDRNSSASFDAVNRQIRTEEAGMIRAGRYDRDGNLVFQGSPAGDVAYTYDALNRLTAVAAGGVTTAYTYDAAGNRLGKTHDTTVTHYLQERGRTYLSMDGDGAVRQYHVWGVGLLYSLDAAGEMRVYHGDERGNVVAATDSTGAVIGQWAYDPYGNVIGAAGVPADGFGCMGLFGVLTDENGLVKTASRYYDPEMGRFLTEDPLGTAAGVNLYAYADADPVNLPDPSGLQTTADFIRTWITQGAELGWRDAGYLSGVVEPEIVKSFGLDEFALPARAVGNNGKMMFEVTQQQVMQVAREEGIDLVKQTGYEVRMEMNGYYTNSEGGILKSPPSGYKAPTSGGGPIPALPTTTPAATTTTRPGVLSRIYNGIRNKGKEIVTGLSTTYTIYKVLLTSDAAAAAALGSEITVGIPVIVGGVSGRIASAYIPVTYNEMTGEWETADQVITNYFLPGQIAKYAPNEDPVLWFREFLKSIDMSYEEYLKIAAEAQQ